jgi:DNA-binding FadR family transcriptional regulator
LVQVPEMLDKIDPLQRLRDWLSRANLPANTRLPPERVLCRELGLSRSALRGALGVLEGEGRIWRHVGRGTFYGPRPPVPQEGVALLARRTHPEEVMEARLVLEPQIAALAAKRATLDDLREIDRCLAKSRVAKDIATFELWDSALHQAIARAANNTLLYGLFEAINSIRERRIWGQLKVASQTPERLETYHAQHTACAEAIRDRDPDAASAAMRTHLETVRANMFES